MVKSDQKNSFVQSSLLTNSVEHTKHYCFIEVFILGISFSGGGRSIVSLPKVDLSSNQTDSPKTLVNTLYSFKDWKVVNYKVLGSTRTHQRFYFFKLIQKSLSSEANVRKESFLLFFSLNPFCNYADRKKLLVKI